MSEEWQDQDGVDPLTMSPPNMRCVVCERTAGEIFDQKQRERVPNDENGVLLRVILGEDGEQRLYCSRCWRRTVENKQEITGYGN